VAAHLEGDGRHSIKTRNGTLLLGSVFDAAKVPVFVQWVAIALVPTGGRISGLFAPACGAMLARRDVAAKLKPGTPAATFGGNPIACRTALAAVEMIEADALLARAEQIGNRFRARLQAMRSRCPWIQDIRVKGAMIGVELSVEGAPIVNQCLQNRLLINCTHGTVLRLLPALTLTDGDLDEGCGILEQVLLAHKT